MSDEAKIEISIKKRDEGALPEDLAEALAPHVEHVADLLSKGFVAGEITDDRFSGWWEIKTP